MAGDQYCHECGEDHGRVFDPPVLCNACETALRYEKDTVGPLRAELKLATAHLERSDGPGDCVGNGGRDGAR